MNIKIFCLLYVLLTPLVVYQIHYLALRVDNMVLWFYRYLAGGLFLLIFIIIFKRPELTKLFREKRNVWIMLIYAVMVIVGSFACSTGLRLTNATTGNLINIMSLPLTAGMACLIWQEEKNLLKNRLFQTGFVIILIGVSGFSLSGGQFTVGGNFSWGVVILLCGMMNNCGSILLLRSLLRNHDAVAVSGVGMSLAGAILFIPICWQGQINAPWQLSAGIFGFLLFSGVFGAVIFLLSLHMLKTLGVLVSRTISLLIPVISAVYGIFFLTETFNFGQLFFGLVLLTGGYLCIGKRPFNAASRSGRRLFSRSQLLLRAGKSN